MNKPNQIFNYYYNGSALRSKAYFRDIQETNNASAYASSIYTNSSDNGICDGMNNCHLTENWANYMNQNVTHHIPILNPYIPLQTPYELQASPTNIYLQQQHHHQLLDQQTNYQILYKNYLDNIYTSYEHFKYIKMTDHNQHYPVSGHPQHLICDNVSRHEFNVEQNKSNDNNNKNNNNDNTLSDLNDAIEPDFQNKIKTSIKYQDRNKKLDFKVNFRDENRKINGCFYDSEAISPRSRESPMDIYLTPPKKKWLKTHFMSSQADDIKTIETVSSPSPSLVVISRPSVNFNPQQPVTIDLSKNTGNSIPLSTLSNGTNSITIYHNIDESQTSLNLSTESSGYVSNSTTSSLGNVSLNQSNVTTNGDEMEVVDVKAIASIVPVTTTAATTTTLLVDPRIPATLHPQTTFNALPMPQSTSTSSSSSSAGRRRTISSNSNSSALRSPSTTTVRAGTREVHNKLEKNRRAHLKECFESLKRQLPVTADEKKTSNLSILGAAIRHIQFLKRKEREYEHEMERLAKEKISAQNRILFLKRELAQWDVDFSKILPDQTEINNSMKSERGGSDSLHESTTAKSGMLFNPSTSLSSITAATTLSNASNNTNLSTSNNIINSGNSVSVSPPPRISTQLSSSAAIMTPLALTAKDDVTSNLTINPVKIPTKSTTTLMPIVASSATQQQQQQQQAPPITTTLSGISNHTNSIPATLSLKTNDSSVASCQPMPLNLHATIQPQNGLKNGLKGYNNNKELKGNNKSSSPVITNLLLPPACITPTSTPLTNSMSSAGKNEQNDPPTKLIKLINGNAILSMDKDNNNKMIHSGLTLQQVVGGGGLVVSPAIQLLTSSQGFKVINQPNGLTTIELSPQINGQASNIQHRPTHHHQITSSTHPQQTVQPGNLQKLLLNGNGATTTTNINTISIPSLTQQQQQQQQTNGNGNHRLTPGGAELNLLPSNSTTSNGLYRNQGKLIVKETNMNSTSRVHVVQSAPTLVVSQPQNTTMTHIITSSSPQLAGKMQPHQYLSATTVKPMIVVNNNNNNNGSPTSTANEIGKN